MTEPEGQGKGRRWARALGHAKPAGKKKAKRASKRASSNGKDSAEVDAVAALNHTVRREILRLLHDPDGPRSPVRSAAKLEHPLSSVSYHFAVLRQRQGIAKVKEVPVRGAMEHFYASKVSDNPMVLDILERTREADERRMCRDA